LFIIATTSTIIYILSLHDALPICERRRAIEGPQLDHPLAHEIVDRSDHKARWRTGHNSGTDLTCPGVVEPRRLGVIDPVERREPDRKSTRLNYSHVSISYAVFCLK